MCMCVCMCVCVCACMYVYIHIPTPIPKIPNPNPDIPTSRLPDPNQGEWLVPTGENGWSRKTPAHKSNNSSSYSSSSAGPGIKKRGAEAPQLVTNPLFLIHTTFCPTEIRVFRRWTSPMSICSSLSAGGKTKEADDPHS